MKPLLSVLAVVLFGAHGANAEVIEAKRYHLGVAGQPEWQEFANSTPHGPQLDLTFQASLNARESTLLIRQSNVKTTWNVSVNGKRIGTLETLSQPLVRALPVPAGLLRAGENRLSIVRGPARMLDDIVVGEFALVAKPRAEALAEATFDVSVSEGPHGTELPCRITIVDTEEALVPLQAPGQPVAARTGVVYTGNGKARIGVAAGRYTVYASRGFEYGVARVTVDASAGAVKPVKLQIRREVPTPGLVACDTHIHTLTFSKHGDATVDERMLTIAGEGIELAVATDHNHHADYTEAATRTGMNRHFRSVVGNEISTKAGHFNAFPVRPDGPVPNAQLTDWIQLLQQVRSVTGAQVITLNHPRDVHYSFKPFGPEQFDENTGAFRNAPRLDVDAIEVVTSAAMQSDVMQLYRDWFALLNRGYRIAAIGSSDTHTVSEFILGQSRTYAVASDRDPAEIDIEDVCASYRAGRLLVSLGLLANMDVDGRFKVGDLATQLGDQVRVNVTVLGPSWTKADRVELFANGIKIREQAIAPSERVEKGRITWTIPRPKHDVHLVAVATGSGVTGPFWEIPRPYQPTAKEFVPRVVGSTNAIWLDADSDGAFTSARGYATREVERAGGDAVKLEAALQRYDAAVGVQARDVLTSGKGK